MVIQSILKNLLIDNESLENYRIGIFASFEDVKRRLFLKERQENNSIPDQYYHLLKEKSFKGTNSLRETLTVGIYGLAKEYLVILQNRIHVKPENQNSWQKFITYMPPLYIQSIFLGMEQPLLSLKKQDIQRYFKDYLLPNFKYTALPHPNIPQLESFLQQQQGLYDLHIHLNGATETDISWQDYLKEPEKIYIELKKAFETNPKVKEQLEQESSLLNPQKFLELLKIAQRIRPIFFDFIFGISKTEYIGLNSQKLMNLIIDTKNISRLTPSYKNPFAKLIGHAKADELSMPIEALMNVMICRYLISNKNDLIASLYHFYLLILGLTNRLLVQQTHQYGFEQFQKHTLNGLREHSEKKFKQRFFQMHGNELRNISFLEGRISPKETYLQTLSQLTDISTGWKTLKKHIEKQLFFEKSMNFSSSGIISPTLKLIVHFIKRQDNGSSKLIRHELLRKNIWLRATSLSYVFNNYKNYQDIEIVGVDAAANEFDTPPEVFGPIFRFLRRKGIKHFTYHAGEDFFHIISGLRAVYEAISFTDLRAGDRIGHATATGISPNHWLEVMGPKILIRAGEWLDNLIFSKEIIAECNIMELQPLLPQITNEIHKIANEIYSANYTIKSLRDAWNYRQYCPILLFASSIEQARYSSVFDNDEWNIIRASNIDSECLEILKKYNDRNFREKYDEPIEIDPFAIISPNDLRLLQKAVLSIMHKKELVIETLPTSNIRIGHYTDYGAYHLWNWFQFEEEGSPVPPIVVGTDDTGIFATNIYNEYANIYCHLVYSANLSHPKAKQIIEQLDKNSRIYSFK